jgi:hypothetical protein
LGYRIQQPNICDSLSQLSKCDSKLDYHPTNLYIDSPNLTPSHRTTAYLNATHTNHSANASGM